jgi:hypothetical protein
MAFETRTYNPDEMIIIIGPVLITSGLADGEFLRVEGEADDVQDVAGADGEVAISRSNDRRATVTLILLQTAAANQGLSVLSNLARNAPNMAGAVQPFGAKDGNGATVYAAENSWIMKPPDASFDRTAQSREWPIRCANLIRNDGGSNLA